MALQLSALIEEYLVDCRARRLAPKTIAGYRAFLTYIRDWLLADGHPDSLRSFTLAHARRYSQELADRNAQRATFVAGGARRGVHALVEGDAPLKASSAYGYLRPLKTFSRWLAAEEQGYLAGDALKVLRLPKRPQAYREALTEEEMGQLVAGYDLRSPIGARDFAILMTYLGTGLRATELTNLREQDVHLGEEYLRVESGKGGKSRTVSLHPEIVVALVRDRNHFRPATADPHFFVTRDGCAMPYGTAALVLRRARKSSAIDRVHLHLLRRTFGVTSLVNGMDLMTLKETFGHSSICTTEIYLTMSEARLREQQRKTNPFAGVKLPKAVRKTKAIQSP